MARMNYEKRIDEGDTVIINYTVADWLPETVKVIHTPAGAGDLWQFERDTGQVFALNPYSPDFHSMVRPEPDDKVPF